MLRVGYIGLGLMGKPMARNIMKAGFPLVVHNRSQAAIVMDTARAYAMPLPATATHTQLYRAMLELGLGELDNSAVLAVYEALTKTHLQEQ